MVFSRVGKETLLSLSVDQSDFLGIPGPVVSKPRITQLAPGAATDVRAGGDTPGNDFVSVLGVFVAFTDLGDQLGTQGKDHLVSSADPKTRGPDCVFTDDYAQNAFTMDSAFAHPGSPHEVVAWILGHRSPDADEKREPSWQKVHHGPSHSALRSGSMVCGLAARAYWANQATDSWRCGSRICPTSDNLRTGNGRKDQREGKT